MLDNIRDKSRPIGLPAEDPHVYELADMVEFCQKYDEVYIYGAAYKQQMLYKLLKNSKKINIKGFVVTNIESNEVPQLYAYSILLVKNNR